MKNLMELVYSNVEIDSIKIYKSFYLLQTSRNFLEVFLKVYKFTILQTRSSILFGTIT